MTIMRCITNDQRLLFKFDSTNKFIGNNLVFTNNNLIVAAKPDNKNLIFYGDGLANSAKYDNINFITE